MSQFVKVDPISKELVPAENPYLGLNKATVVSDETMDGIEAHINDMNVQGYALISSIGRGNHVMLFWKKI